MRTKVVQGIEMRQVQRQKRKVLLVPEMVDRSCKGCVFLPIYKQAGSCLVRWKSARSTKDRHVDCSGADNDDGVGRIYIDPDEVGEYLAVRAAAILEGDDDE